MHKNISTDQAPMAIGPYSQAIVSLGTRLLFISGQIPLDAKTLKISSTNVREQTITVLENLQAILEAAGASKESVVKTTVFLKSMEDFATVNEEYKKFFVEHKPARACVEVSRLPKDVLIEIEAIAVF